MYAETVMADRDADGIRGLSREWSRFRCHLEGSPLAALPIGAIRRKDIREWQRWMSQKDASDKRGARKISQETIKRSQALVSAVFAHALDREIIDVNPCVGVKLKKRADEHATREKWAWFTPAEQRALATCEAIPLADRLLIRFAIGTGLRQGELLSLMLADLHVDGDEPRVVVRFGAKGKPPKSGKIRTVPLFGDALAAAREWLAYIVEWTKGRNVEGLAFPSKRGLRRHAGKPLGASDVFHKHCAAAGVKRARFHDLRHTCASSLVAGWWGRQWTLLEVRDMLGHSSVTISERYAHLGQTSLKSAAQATVIDHGPPANMSDTQSVFADGAQQIRTYVWRALRRVREYRARVVAGVISVAS